MDVTCISLTKQGKKCSKKAIENGLCHIHCGRSSARISTVSKESATPKRKRTPQTRTPSPAIEKRGKEHKESMEKEWRLGRDSPGMGSLGWSPSKHYYMDEYGKRILESYPKKYPNPEEYPEEFLIVTQKLMNICKQIDPDETHVCTIHPTLPGVQWINRKTEANDERKRLLHLLANHFTHNVESDDNSNYPIYDRDYCMCNEWKVEETAFKTLLEGEGLDWQEYHGLLAKGTRNVGRELKEKIMKDAVEFLAQEYKIHLQPKPEYQFSVVRELTKMLQDAEFKSQVEAFKVAIPYHRVKTDANLPVIVIYPMPGKASAKYVLEKIEKHFSKFDSSEIGLNHTPRFNKKINELIYAAGGSGDHKKYLPASLFSGSGKEFYKGYEL